MNVNTSNYSSELGRRARKVEDGHYGGEIERENPVPEKKSFLKQAAPGWFGCVPSGFMVTPLVVEGEVIKNAYFIVPVE